MKDTIASGGENAFSIEVERALHSDPAKMQAAVIGIPLAAWREAVHGIVVPRPGHAVTAEELIARCHTRIGSYICSKCVAFRTEPLLAGPAGKVQKNLLRDPHCEGRDRKI